jgi:hypothetical protein
VTAAAGLLPRLRDCAEGGDKLGRRGSSDISWESSDSLALSNVAGGDEGGGGVAFFAGGLPRRGGFSEARPLQIQTVLGVCAISGRGVPLAGPYIVYIGQCILKLWLRRAPSRGREGFGRGPSYRLALRLTNCNNHSYDHH